MIKIKFIIWAFKHKHNLQLFKWTLHAIPDGLCRSDPSHVYEGTLQLLLPRMWRRHLDHSHPTPIHLCLDQTTRDHTEVLGRAHQWAAWSAWFVPWTEDRVTNLINHKMLCWLILASLVYLFIPCNMPYKCTIYIASFQTTAQDEPWKIMFSIQ